MAILIDNITGFACPSIHPSGSVSGCVHMLCCSGIAIGHIYFFLEDVFPQQPGGFKMIRTPSILLVKFFVAN